MYNSTGFLYFHFEIAGKFFLDAIIEFREKMFSKTTGY